MSKGLKIILRIIESSVILIFFWCAWNHNLVTYGINQGIGEMKIIWNARPIEEVMNDSSVSDTIKSKLKLIEEIKKFAIDALGLKASKNYTTFFDQHRKPVLWVLTAAEKYKMKSYEWTFPVVGTVGYKGFFIFEKGKKEEQKLIDEGYDTDLGSTGGWSTLGFFRDPILSNFLNRSEGQLAELIIHEMTHSTLYVKSSVDFNENLANFIGEEGAVQFLRFHFGDSSDAIRNYLNQKEDYNLFSGQMLTGMQQLDSLYKTFSDQMDPLQKETAKQKMIHQIVLSFDTISFHNKERYRNIFSKEVPNNTDFLSYKRYDSQKDKMKKEMYEKFKNDFKSYLEFLKKKYS